MDVIYGINPVTEALKMESCQILKIAVAREAGKEPVQGILALAAEKRIPVAFLEKRELEKLAGRRSHQGIVGLCKPFAYADLDRVIEGLHHNFHRCLLLLLDEMGKPLEHAAAHPETTDIYLLQELAECANRSKQTPFLFVGILHQTFERYAGNLDSGAQRSRLTSGRPAARSSASRSRHGVKARSHARSGARLTSS